MTELTHDQLIQYAERYGIRGRKTLTILGKNQQFVNAMNSPVGIEFLRFLVNRIEVNRNEFDRMDIDSSNAKFIEARARYNEASDLLSNFLEISEGHEKLLTEVREDITNLSRRM